MLHTACQLYAQLTKQQYTRQPPNSKKGRPQLSGGGPVQAASKAGYLPPCFFSILPQVSFRVAARLNTGAPGLLSFSSAQK